MSHDGKPARRRRRDMTPDAHLFPTRRYDLVKEFVIAVVVVGVLVVVLAAVFSSPDRKAITLENWANADHHYGDDEFLDQVVAAGRE